MRPSSRLRRRALDWIAAALGAAAIFVVPGVAIGLANGLLDGWDLVWGVPALLAGLAVLAFHLRRRTAFPALVLGGVLAWAFALGSAFVGLNTSLCGDGALAQTVAGVALFAVYFGVATWALLGRFRPLWGLPLAVALAATAHYGLLWAIPGGHGYCET